MAGRIIMAKKINLSPAPAVNVPPEVIEAQRKKVILKKIKKMFNRVKGVTHAEVQVGPLLVGSNQLFVLTVGPLDYKTAAAFVGLVKSYVHNAMVMAEGKVGPGVRS